MFRRLQTHPMLTAAADVRVGGAVFRPFVCVDLPGSVTYIYDHIRGIPVLQRHLNFGKTSTGLWQQNRVI